MIEQRDAVGARGALHAVEGAGDVGAHPLALALRERAVVAAAARPRASPGGASSASALASIGADRAPPRADLEAVAHRRRGCATGANESRVGERDARARAPLAARDALRRRAAEREVRRLRQVARARAGAVGETGSNSRA